MLLLLLTLILLIIIKLSTVTHLRGDWSKNFTRSLRQVRRSSGQFEYELLKSDVWPNRLGATTHTEKLVRNIFLRFVSQLVACPTNSGPMWSTYRGRYCYGIWSWRLSFDSWQRKSPQRPDRLSGPLSFPANGYPRLFPWGWSSPLTSI
jgi:hypothetical protein